MTAHAPPAQMSPQKMRVTRQLRSKEDTKIDESLFNFEEDPSVINPDQPITVADRVPDGEVLPMNFEFNREKIQVSANLVNLDEGAEINGHGKRGRSLRRTTVNKGHHDDPLNEALYSIYHRRMEKEEKRMFNRDREKVYIEADKMKTQLEALKHEDWPKALPSITYIRDQRDYDEMHEKRELTIKSLETLLRKFDTYKKEEERVSLRLRHGYVPPPPHEMNDLKLYTKLNKRNYIGDSDTDEEEDGLSVEEIKRKRLKKQAKLFGPVIKIKFGFNILVAEPFKNPRIEYV